MTVNLNRMIIAQEVIDFSLRGLCHLDMSSIGGLELVVYPQSLSQLDLKNIIFSRFSFFRIFFIRYVGEEKLFPAMIVCVEWHKLSFWGAPTQNRFDG